MNARSTALVLVILLAVTVAGAQRAAKSKSRMTEATSSAGGEAELVSGGDDPVIRIPVAHDHGLGTPCIGYLYFSRSTIRYEVVNPPDSKSHSFSYPRSSVTVAGQWTIWGSAVPAAEFKFSGGGTYHFYHATKESVDTSTPEGKFNWQTALPWQDLIDAYNRFDEIVSRLEEAEARAHPVPPTISLLEPTGVSEGSTVKLTGATVRIHGVASANDGIASVNVNGRAAFLKTLAPSTVEFDLSDVALHPGMNPIVVLATSTNNGTAQTMFTVAIPEPPTTGNVRILTHPGNAQVYFDDALEGTTGLQDGVLAIPSLRAGTYKVRVTLAGYKEWDQPVTVAAGGSQNLDATLTPEGPPPFTVQDIVDMLHGGLSKKRIEMLVAERGVGFSLDDDSENKIRSAGGNTELLLAIAKAKR